MNVFSSQLITQFVSDYLYWVFLGVIFVNLTQRKHRETAARKRTATVYLAIAAFLVHTTSNLILVYEGSDLLMLAAVATAVGAIAYFREHAFPFRLRCRVSGRLLDLNTVLYRDSNILPECEEVPQSTNAQEGEKGDES